MIDNNVFFKKWPDKCGVVIVAVVLLNWFEKFKTKRFFGNMFVL